MLSFATACPFDCNQHGQCIDDACICEGGFFGPDCAANGLSLSSNFNFYWTYSASSSSLDCTIEVLSIEAWAGVGFKAANALNMHDASFIIADKSGPNFTVVEYFASTVTPPFVPYEHSHITYFEADVSPQGSLYRFSRYTNHSNFFGFDPTQVYMMYAHGAQGQLLRQYHGPNVASRLTYVDLIGEESCPFKCNGKGTCVGDECYCFAGNAPDCHDNVIQFTDSAQTFNFTWSFDGLTLNGTLDLMLDAWTGVGFRNNNSNLMVDSHLIVGQQPSVSNFLVQEFTGIGNTRPTLNPSQALSYTSGELDTENETRSLYRFTRNMSDGFFGLDPEQVFLIWAHGPSDGAVALKYHTNKSRATVTVGPVNLTKFDATCEDSCNGHGKCVNGQCQCDPGYLPPVCTKASDNELVFDSEFKMTWSVDEAEGSLNVNLIFSDSAWDTCWASVGLRYDNGVSMAGADYWFAEPPAMTSGVVRVTERYSSLSDPESQPSVYASQSSINHASFVQSPDGSTTYSFSRQLSPSNGARPIVKDDYVYISWAHCGANGQTPTKYYHGAYRSIQALPAINFFSGAVTPTKELTPLKILETIGVGIVVLLVVVAASPKSFNLAKPGLRGWPRPVAFALFAVFLVAAVFAGVRFGNGATADLALFLGIVVLFSTCLALNLVSVNSVVGDTLQRRLTHSCTVGEAGLLIVYVTSLAVFTFHYARLLAPSMSGWVEELTRLCGHVAELHSAFALFPVAHSSPLVLLFGVPFERAVAYHRWIGMVIFSSVLLHLLGWWKLWLDQGVSTWSANVFENDRHDPEGNTRWLGHLAFAFLFGFVIFTMEIVRRKRFELFYYTHHLAFGYLTLATLHSKSLMNGRGNLFAYLLPSLFLYAVDRVCRFYRGRLTSFTLLGANPETTEITRLEFSGLVANVFGTRQQFKFSPGQYCFVNIPSISALEWHPFSFSSAPYFYKDLPSISYQNQHSSEQSIFTLHIKSMDVGSFTHKLRQQVIYGNALGRINIDGPYGCPSLDIEDYPVIALVCGGVGVTPCMSMLEYLFRNQTTLKQKKLRKVFFSWVVKDPACFVWFKHIIAAIQKDTSGTFEIQLFCTLSEASKADLPNKADVRPETNALLYDAVQSAQYLEEGKTTSYQIGRPDYLQLLNALRVQIVPSNSRHQVGMFACGPASLIESLERQLAICNSDEGHTCPVDFHKESFLL